MNRRTFFHLFGASALAVASKASVNPTHDGLRQAQWHARDWATRHTIYRPSTGQAFVSPSHGRTGNDYIEVGNIHSDEPFGTNLNRQQQVR